MNLPAINSCNGSFEAQTPTVKISHLLHNSSNTKNNSLLN